MKKANLMPLSLVSLTMLSSATAEESVATAIDPTVTPSIGQSLDQAADDPTASLMALQVADWYTSRFHGLAGEDANTFVLRPVIPFKLGETKNIFRMTLPFITDSPFTDTGISDTTIFNLTVFDESWGRWGVGPVALLPTGGASRGAENWALGPAIGFTARYDKWLLGLFNQNLFSVNPLSPPSTMFTTTSLKKQIPSSNL